ncbi:replication endonuclease [Saccharospirillum salsuginis]|uniref:Replication gene A protein-like domain-containing protein n=1 Tax=Saccharospirillum salsuginis TaxID=418750 RepID=A0A918N7X8_9GAMM|nr:replication endonuclease [Saccharospirillum salsuginis]GGX52257.1 hypothetical protein GCM10007392_19480 [Saccharospirillum salsuginis]
MKRHEIDNWRFRAGCRAALGPIKPKGLPVNDYGQNVALRRMRDTAQAMGERAAFGRLPWDADDIEAGDYTTQQAEQVEGILAQYGATLPPVDNNPWPMWFGRLCHDMGKLNPRAFWAWWHIEPRAEVRAKLDEHGIEVDGLGELDPPASALVALQKIINPKWWARQWRKFQARRVDEIARALGQVRKGLAPYCADATLSTWRKQQAANRAMLAATDAVSDQHGEAVEVPLADLVEASLANPAIRRAELMTRLRGFEIHARDLGYKAEFWTMTAPSRYHPAKTVYPKKGGKIQAINRAWVEAGRPTVREAQAYLCDTWQRIRAKFKREGLDLFGFRIAEPHGDGCPHWHLVVFVQSDAASAYPEKGEPTPAGVQWFNRGKRRPVLLGQAAQIARHYALEDNPDEPGAKQARFDCEPIKTGINPETGEPYSAAGYVAKYIAKNLDGKFTKPGTDEPTPRDGLAVDYTGGGTVADNAERVRAWSSTHGVRQFQQFGGPPVGIWRELRRLFNIETAPDLVLQGLFEQTEQEDKAEAWAAYCALWRSERVQIRLDERQREEVKEWFSVSPVTGEILKHPETRREPCRGRYGLPVVAVDGISINGRRYQTRPFYWELRRRPPGPPSPESPPDWGRLLTGPAKPVTPWTCVNNCTDAGGPIPGITKPKIETAGDLQKWIDTTP